MLAPIQSLPTLIFLCKSAQIWIISHKIPKTFSGGGAQPSPQTLPCLKEVHSLPNVPPRHLQFLDVFGFWSWCLGGLSPTSTVKILAMSLARGQNSLNKNILSLTTTKMNVINKPVACHNQLSLSCHIINRQQVLIWLRAGFCWWGAWGAAHLGSLSGRL